MVEGAKQEDEGDVQYSKRSFFQSSWTFSLPEPIQMVDSVHVSAVMGHKGTLGILYISY